MPAMGPFWSRWRVRAGYPVALVYWLLARPNIRSLALGAVVAVLGVLLRGAAAGYLRKGEALTTSGPYAWTRNPLYFGSALIGAGVLVAGHTWAGALILVVYFVLFYSAVIDSEERALRAKYGQAFQDYAARVPLFWPRSPQEHESSSPFSWDLYLRNREYRAALGALLGWMLLGLKMYWRG